MGDNYIVSGTPYLVTSRRPIYKVPTGRLDINPYHWKPGKVVVIRGWPFNGVELRDTITPPTPGTIQESQESQESQELPEPSVAVGQVLREVEIAIAAYHKWYDNRV